MFPSFFSFSFFKSSTNMLCVYVSGEEVNEDEVQQEEQEVDVSELDEEQQMARLLGIGGFDTTKGKHVKDNSETAARGASAKTKQREYRQYMNRKIIRKDGLFGMQGPAGKGGKGKGNGRAY
jgi:hypothetical protein